MGELEEFLEKKLRQKAGTPEPPPPPLPPPLKPDYTNSIVFVVCALVVLAAIYFAYSALTTQVEQTRRDNRITLADVPPNATLDQFVLDKPHTVTIPPYSCYLVFPPIQTLQVVRSVEKDGFKFSFTPQQDKTVEVKFYWFPKTGSKCPFE